MMNEVSASKLRYNYRHKRLFDERTKQLVTEADCFSSFIIRLALGRSKGLVRTHRHVQNSGIAWKWRTCLPEDLFTDRQHKRLAALLINWLALRAHFSPDRMTAVALVPCLCAISWRPFRMRWECTQTRAFIIAKDSRVSSLHSHWLNGKRPTRDTHSLRETCHFLCTLLHCLSRIRSIPN